MYLAFLAQVLLSALLVSAVTPTRTLNKRQTTPPSKFVTSQNGQFMFNGSTLDFVGTNAYWLPALNSDEDIDFTLGNMSAAGIKVVRTWAFNDVDTIPVNGTWFQLIANGTTVINDGPNGLQKLDTVVKLAEKHGLFVVFSLTNNWNPGPNQSAGISINARDNTPGTNKVPPRNALSNDYGGMDAYVREFSSGKNHDDFYVDPTILEKFKNYTTQVVSRYVESPAIFAWEIANDPRCNSSLPATVTCNTQTITKFHSTIAQHINQVDPNHLVTSGNQGFFCVDCPKLFPRVLPPPPQTSSTPTNNRRRSPPKPLTKRGLLEERKAMRKKIRNMQKRTSATGGIRIRGRWMSTETKRQSDDQGVGPAFDGSQGVDSEDILNIPQIGFGTFQLFPDQNSYGVDDPTLPAFNNTVNQGLDWIRRHADNGRLFGKPVTLNGFGLVTQDNAPSFVPFNQTQAPFGSDPPPASPTQQPFGVTDQQRDDAYAQWLQAGLQSGLQGMLQYQWSQGNLTTGVGTAISPTVSGTPTSPTVSGIGLSPNDGYSIQGVGLDQAIGTLQQAAQALGPG